ncbi:transmembrane protein, putative [Medicago truncatula]|uniref:Transmembrane protein, putative n=1 Tax=Medicago truncatula TaxID=3880 RepID=A0A072VLL0_MEDTR|nr:transmembrane protein, putative [Medicago truncatula]
MVNKFVHGLVLFAQFLLGFVSMASTSSASLTPTAKGYFKPIHHESTDIGWPWSSYKDERITRAKKKHQLRIKGEVKPCEKTPEDVKILLKNHFDGKQAAKDASSRPAKELPMQTPANAPAPRKHLHDELGNLAELSPMQISFAILTTGEFSTTKREILEVLEIGNRGAILSGLARFSDQNEGLVLPQKSWYDFWWRGAIFQNRGAIL